MFDNQDRARNMASSPQPLKGKLVYTADNTKVGSVSAVDAQAGYFVAQKGVLVPHDLYIPLSAIVTNSTAVALNLTKETLKDPRFTAAPTASARPTAPAVPTDTAATSADSTAPTVPTDTAATSADSTAPTDTAATSAARPTLPTDDSVATSAKPTTQPRSTAPLNAGSTQVEDITVPIREETLLANKVTEKIGDVHVHRYVVEEEQTIAAPITHEEISIEHVVITNQPTEIDAFTEKDINVPVMGERLIAGKETHVVEEVHIYKHQVIEQQQVSGMLRKEHLRVDGDVQLEDDARDERLQGDSTHQDRSSWS